MGASLVASNFLSLEKPYSSLHQTVTATSKLIARSGHHLKLCNGFSKFQLV